MMRRLSITERLRVGDVRRWHIVRTTRDQTLGDHLARVALLAAEVVRLSGGPREAQLEAAFLALHHDIDEVVLGDVPTPTKRALGVPFPAIDSVAAALGDSASQAVRDAVHGADQLEALLWITQNGLGMHARVVARGIEQSFQACWVGRGDPVAVTLCALAEELLEGER